MSNHEAPTPKRNAETQVSYEQLSEELQSNVNDMQEAAKEVETLLDSMLQCGLVTEEGARALREKTKSIQERVGASKTQVGKKTNKYIEGKITKAMETWKERATLLKKLPTLVEQYEGLEQECQNIARGTQEADPVKNSARIGSAKLEAMLSGLSTSNIESTVDNLRKGIKFWQNKKGELENILGITKRRTELVRSLARKHNGLNIQKNFIMDAKEKGLQHLNKDQFERFAEQISDAKQTMALEGEIQDILDNTANETASDRSTRHWCERMLSLIQFLSNKMPDIEKAMREKSAALAEVENLEEQRTTFEEKLAVLRRLYTEVETREAQSAISRALDGYSAMQRRGITATQLPELIQRLNTDIQYAKRVRGTEQENSTQEEDERTAIATILEEASTLVDEGEETGWLPPSSVREDGTHASREWTSVQLLQRQATDSTGEDLRQTKQEAQRLLAGLQVQKERYKSQQERKRVAKEAFNDAVKKVMPLIEHGEQHGWLPFRFVIDGKSASKERNNIHEWQHADDARKLELNTHKVEDMITRLQNRKRKWEEEQQ